MAFKDRLRRLERGTRKEMIEVPQSDGSVARFPQSAGVEAFLHNIDRMKTTPEEAGEPHPLCVAASNSSDPSWRDSFVATIGPHGPIEDLSE
jgi:hypothetical protein